MKFLYYDLGFLLIFCLGMAFLFLKNKKNVVVEGRIFILYKTKVGLKLISWLGAKFKKTLSVLSYVVITTGYLLMILAIYLFVQMVVSVAKMPEILKIAKVPPIMPLIPYLPQMFNIDFLPPFYFTYWIIAIAIIAIFHEGAHGTFAKFYKVKIKSTGFGFLGPFLAAFVEPDEKQLARKKKKEQIVVLSAGSFANLVMAVIFMIIIALFFYYFFSPQGVKFETYASSAINISSITAISNVLVANPSMQDILLILPTISAADLQLAVNNKTTNLTKITAANSTYFAVTENLESSIKQAKNASLIRQLLVFDDTPALRAGLQGAITKINFASVKNLKEFEAQLAKYHPNDDITIEVMNKDYSHKYYNIMLAARTDNSSAAYLGAGFLVIAPKKGIIGFIGKLIFKFKNPNIFYMPKYSIGWTIFIYNLLWWIIVINLSVAIMNMLPLGIFDGGRVFYLTMLAITKSEKKAKWAFRIMTYLLLGLVIALTVLWAFVI